VTAPAIPAKEISMISRNSGYKSPACSAFTDLAAEWAINRIADKPQRKLRPCPLSEPTY
jgi:LysR family cyn operon transcriptional activator